MLMCCRARGFVPSHVELWHKPTQSRVPPGLACTKRCRTRRCCPPRSSSACWREKEEEKKYSVDTQHYSHSHQTVSSWFSPSSQTFFFNNLQDIWKFSLLSLFPCCTLLHPKPLCGHGGDINRGSLLTRSRKKKKNEKRNILRQTSEQSFTMGATRLQFWGEKGGSSSAQTALRCGNLDIHAAGRKWE